MTATNSTARSHILVAIDIAKAKLFGTAHGLSLYNTEIRLTVSIGRSRVRINLFTNIHQVRAQSRAGTFEQGPFLQKENR
jgi:hypothetical protein